MEDQIAMDGDEKENDHTAILVGAICGGLFIIGLVIVAVLYVRHKSSSSSSSSSKNKTKKSRAANKKNSSTLVEDTDGIELIENDPRWRSNSVDNPLTEHTVTEQDAGAVQWSNSDSNPLYNDADKKETTTTSNNNNSSSNSTAKKINRKKKKGRQTNVVTSKGETKTVDTELDLVFDRIVSNNNNAVNSNPMFKNETVTTMSIETQEQAIVLEDNTHQKEDLPEDWEALLDEVSGDTYYLKRSSGLTQWKKPNKSTETANGIVLPQEDSREKEDLPDDWEAMEDEISGETYYFKRSSGLTQWEKPT